MTPIKISLGTLILSLIVLISALLIPTEIVKTPTSPKPIQVIPEDPIKEDTVEALWAKQEKEPLLLTELATVNNTQLFFFWDPLTQKNLMLSSTPNTQNNYVISHKNRHGEALLNQTVRRFQPESSKPTPAEESPHYTYWQGYKKGFSLYESYGSMNPEEENPDTGEISKHWTNLNTVDPLIKDIPPSIHQAIWQDPIQQTKTLNNFPPTTKDYWQGFIHGAHAALLDKPNEQDLTEWYPSFGEPAVTSPKKQTSKIGEKFSYQITTSTQTTSFSAEPLPPGISLDPITGTLQGTIKPYQNPNKPSIDTFQIELTATNENGTTATLLELTIIPP